MLYKLLLKKLKIRGDLKVVNKGYSKVEKEIFLGIFNKIQEDNNLLLELCKDYVSGNISEWRDFKVAYGRIRQNELPLEKGKKILRGIKTIFRLKCPTPLNPRKLSSLSYYEERNVVRQKYSIFRGISSDKKRIIKNLKNNKKISIKEKYELWVSCVYGNSKKNKDRINKFLEWFNDGN